MKGSDESSLLIRQIYRHDVQRVFDAFRRAEAVVCWLSPHPDIRPKVIEYDFRVGGRYKIQYALPDGNRTTLAGEFLVIDQAKHLVFDWRWEDPDPHAGIDTLVSVDFIAGENTTEVIVSHTRLDGTGMKQRHSDGWTGTLNRLGVWLESGE